MPSLFNPSDAASIVERIGRLRPDSTAQWGKMNAGEMMAHSQRPLEVATGDLVLKGNLLGFLFGGMVKKKLMKATQLSHNSPTVPSWRTVGSNPDFEKERGHLVELVQKFASMKLESLAAKHPFFGKMSVDEWDALQYKHLDHHLRQFDV